MIADALSREAAELVLAATRITGLVLSAPILWVHAPTRVRAALVIILAFVCHGSTAVVPGALDSYERTILCAPSELFIGVAMGLVVRFAIAGVEMAGEIMSPVLGLGAASLFDPHTQVQETAITQMLRLLCVLLLLLLGAHRIVIGSLLASFRVLPIGTLTDPGLAAFDILHLSNRAIATGVRLSLPVVASLLLVQLGLAFVSRAAPSMQIFSIGFTLCLVVGGLILMSSLPELAREIEVDLSQLGIRIETVLEDFARG